MRYPARRSASMRGGPRSMETVMTARVATPLRISLAITGASVPAA